MERKVSFTTSQPSKIKRGLSKQFSFDSSLHSIGRRRSSIETMDIRRVQSFNEERKKTTRKLKVMFRVKPKMIMYKLTLSSPEKTPLPDILEQYDVVVKGAHRSKLCTSKYFEKTCQVFFDSTHPVGKHVERAEIIVKEREKEIEHIPFVEVIESDNARILNSNQIILTTSEPEGTLPDIRLFKNDDSSLCEEEKMFLRKRKMYIQAALKKPKRPLDKTNLKRPLDEDKLVNCPEDVPHIALIGSGGGFRAMIAMSGIFNALYDTGLLDVILYTAVLSGSSWYISTLYSHPDWPNIDPREIQRKMKADIFKNTKFSKLTKLLGYASSYFRRKSSEKWNFTLNVFGPMLGDCLLSDRLESKLSDQAGKMSEGTTPLPLLSAIHAKPDENARKFHEWVEFSPYEASIPKYGTAINMKHLGSEFFKGQLIKETELRLYEIMGICGSAFTLTYEELRKKDDKITEERISKHSAYPGNDAQKISGTLQTKKNRCDRNEFDELDGLKNHTADIGIDELDGRPEKQLPKCPVKEDLAKYGNDSVETKQNNGSHIKFNQLDEDDKITKKHISKESAYSGTDAQNISGTLQTMKNRGDTNEFDELDGSKIYTADIGIDELDGRPENQLQTGSFELDVLEGDSIAKRPDNHCNISGNPYESDEIDEILKVNEQIESHQPSDEDLQDLELILSRICKIQEKDVKASFTTEDVFIVPENNCEQNGHEGVDELDGLCSSIVPEPVKKWFLKNRDKFQRAAVVNNFMRKVSFCEELKESSKRNAHSTLFENYINSGDMEKLCLIDAGLAFNSPYPLLFKHGRDIDLILSFDFTDRKADRNSPFKTILRAEEWARTHEIKFPKVEETIRKNGYDEKAVQELYVFEDENDMECPIIMHFVLINNLFRSFKKPNVPRDDNEKEFKFANFSIYDEPSAFNCMNFHYSDINFERLSQLSEFIVLNNQEEIEKYIRESILRKSRISVKKKRSRHPTS